MYKITLSPTEKCLVEDALAHFLALLEEDCEGIKNDENLSPYVARVREAVAARLKLGRELHTRLENAEAS